jgi:hypothetical protein
MKIRAALLLGLSATTAAPALAQSADSLPPEVRAAADRLGRCMVSKSSGEDRIAVAGWMLAAMGSAPQLKGVVTVEPGKKEQADRTMAAFFTRIMTVDCAAEAKVLFASGDRRAFELAGRPLGEIAMRELLGNPVAMDSMAAYTRYLKESDFAGVTK